MGVGIVSSWSTGEAAGEEAGSPVAGRLAVGTRDEHVAAQVTTGLLRRPDVAFKAMSDDYPDYALAV